MTYRILCVDDERDLLETLRDFLTQVGYDVTLAENGRVALTLIERNPPFDLVLCDIAMPGMDGLSLLKLLRGNASYLHVPFIFMTALNQKEDMITAHQLGCDEYVVKPMDLDVLEAMVESRIRRSQSIRGLGGDHSEMAFQQMILQAFSDEMMEPTNAIVVTSSFITQMLEKQKDEVLQQRFKHVYSNAAQQLSMLQQLTQMLLPVGETASHLADYPCPVTEVIAHIKRLLKVQHMQEAVSFQEQQMVSLLCDPFMLSKALASLIIRSVTEEAHQKLVLDVSQKDAESSATLILYEDGQKARLEEMSVQPVRSRADFMALNAPLKGRLIAVMYLYEVAEAHEAELELLSDAQGAVKAYRMRFPATRSVRMKAAI